MLSMHPVDRSSRTKTSWPLSSSASPIVTIPYEEAYEAGFEDMPRRVPELSKVHALIGYEPAVGLDEIIRRVVASQRDV